MTASDSPQVVSSPQQTQLDVLGYSGLTIGLDLSRGKCLPILDGCERLHNRLCCGAQNTVTSVASLFGCDQKKTTYLKCQALLFYQYLIQGGFIHKHINNQREKEKKETQKVTFYLISSKGIKTEVAVIICVFFIDIVFHLKQF